MFKVRYSWLDDPGKLIDNFVQLGGKEEKKLEKEVTGRVQRLEEVEEVRRQEFSNMSVAF